MNIHAETLFSTNIHTTYIDTTYIHKTKKIKKKLAYFNSKTVFLSLGVTDYFLVTGYKGKPYLWL